MPRILSDDLNILNIRDNLSGSDIAFSYRMPTTAERIGYSNAVVQRRNGKIVNQAAKTRIEYGLKILAGIREGDFLVKAAGGENVCLSSDPESAFYREDWKAQVKTHAADLVELLAIQVFDMPAQTVPVDTEADDAEGDADAGDPTP